MKILLLLGTGAVLAIGCAHHQEAVAKVDDSGLSRLNETQMEPVDEARIEEGRANDAVAKARANEAEARAGAEVAKSEREVAEAQLKRAVAERDMLKKQYADRDTIARTENDIAAAQEQVKAIDLKLQYLNTMIAVAQAERKAAEAHLETAKARTEQVKLSAMRRANAPQANEVNAGAIDKRFADAQAAKANANREAADLRTKAVELYNRWQQMDARVRMLARPENPPVPPPTSGEPTK